MERIAWFDKRAIYLGDISDSQFNDMVEFCEEMNLRLIQYSNEDVSDVSLRFDMVAVFHFENEEDALLFKLKFGGKYEC